VRECYLERKSPLFGTRLVVGAHDESVIEPTLERVHDAGYRLAELMKKAAKVFMPDVAMEAKPAAMLRWTKESETVHDSKGRLIPCDM